MGLFGSAGVNLEPLDPCNAKPDTGREGPGSTLARKCRLQLGPQPEDYRRRGFWARPLSEYKFTRSLKPNGSRGFWMCHLSCSQATDTDRIVRQNARGEV